MSSNSPYLIVGLGNPGLKYEKNRHNIGFILIDYLAAEYGTSLDQVKFSANTGTARICGTTILFIKPDTYMNLSGKAVAAFADFYRCEPENILVIHDDIDMSPGRLKLTSGGGAGGHNGIKSIMSCMGQKGFYRLKFGVGRPGKDGVHPDFPVDKYVLSNFLDEELQMIDERKKIIKNGVELFLQGERNKAVGMINSVK